MANYRMNKIAIGSDTYEVAEWYGVCSTAANTQAKTVSISGFTSAQLVDGCKVTVLFTNYQNYNGAPTLNVSSTGAKTIRIVSGTNAERFEWSSGQIVTFVYFNGYWFIENGGHASAFRYGITRLTTDYESGLAADGASVIRLRDSVVPYSVWDGSDVTKTTLLTTATPNAAGWTVDGNSAYCEVAYDADALETAINAVDTMRTIKLTIGDSVMFLQYGLGNDYPFYLGYVQTLDGKFTVMTSGVYCAIFTDATNIGEYAIKIEMYSIANTGTIMTEPLMDYYLKNNGYLTLADLPVWDGSVT